MTNPFLNDRGHRSAQSSSEQPGIEVDFAYLDLMVRSADGQSPAYRPIVAVAFDRTSRLPIGMSIGKQAPDTVMETIDALMPSYAALPTGRSAISPSGYLPKTVYCDNGRESFSSSFLVRLAAAGLSVSFNQAGKKGRAERFFTALNDAVVHGLTAGSWERHEADGWDEEVFELENLRKFIVSWFSENHSTTAFSPMKATPQIARRPTPTDSGFATKEVSTP